MEKASSIDSFEKKSAEPPGRGRSAGSNCRGSGLRTSGDPMRKLISTGSPFEKTAGYSRAVVQGDWCFVSGTTGYDYATMTMPDSVEDAGPQLPGDDRARRSKKAASPLPMWCARTTTSPTPISWIGCSRSSARLSAISGPPRR